ncbi:NAD(P)/FAD-dependent oxidoreductase [Marinoscillum sp.]|uniref:NAD(P)/FAD-dependent oxidoreductase n=1 Tax=Marinoscillum sp. TaxID=2024838 RepID=UPI003BA8C1D3
MKKVNYLIVGQGIAGSLLAVELIRAGRDVHVINHETENTSSNKAAGIYNPITGRQMVKTWLADSLFPILEPYYQQLEREVDLKFLYPKSIYRPFYSHEELNDWEGKAAELAYQPYIKEILTKASGIKGVRDEFGGLLLNYSGYVNLPDMIRGIRHVLEDKGNYTNELFDHSQLKLADGAHYKNIKADYVIFCDGPMVTDNPLWNYLPFKPVKGEILEIDTTLPEDMIVNRGVFVLPKNGHFSVGSTYDHDHLDYVPSEKGIKNLQDRLHKLYQKEYTIVSKSAGVRPATYDRRPFIGQHTDHPQVGIFNGFGTKGVSLVPFFAGQYVNYLERSGELLPEVDVRRVKI